MRAAALFLALTFVLRASEMPDAGAIAYRSPQTSYFWSTTRIANTAQLVTLLCRDCHDSAMGGSSNVPLVSVLRDDLGDNSLENDRITAVWLLSYTRPGIGQRILSAVPFFYWRIGHGSIKPGDLGPLLEMNSLQRPMVKSIARDVLQWTTLDPSFMPVRASTRAYRANSNSRERVYLEQTIGYLREAPNTDTGSGLTSAELHTVLARLELRKRLLGGFVTPRAALQFGASANTRYEQIRTRNWELLRQCAEKTGLYFEPFSLAGARGEYAILWAPLSGLKDVPGTRVGPIWKLLNLKKPSDTDLQHIPETAIYERPAGLGDELIPVTPLGVYSLDYPKVPLLMIDFRNRHHVRWRAMAQRSIDDVTAGVIGISHFTNWYYYVAADLYDFVASRRGAPMDQAERLDCYSDFRAKLALDRNLDPRLRAAMRGRIDSLAMNPLEPSGEQSIHADLQNYRTLLREADNGRLLARIRKDRERELASYDRSAAGAIRDEFLHLATLGLFTRRPHFSGEQVDSVDLVRRVQYQLSFLSGLANQQTPPEIVVSSNRITSAIAELERLVPKIPSPRLARDAGETLSSIRSRSQDHEVQSACTFALAAFHRAETTTRQVALKPSAVHVSKGKLD